MPTSVSRFLVSSSTGVTAPTFMVLASGAIGWGTGRGPAADAGVRVAFGIGRVCSTITLRARPTGVGVASISSVRDSVVKRAGGSAL